MGCAAAPRAQAAALLASVLGTAALSAGRSDQQRAFEAYHNESFGPAAVGFRAAIVNGDGGAKALGKLHCHLADTLRLKALQRGDPPNAAFEAAVPHYRRCLALDPAQHTSVPGGIATSPNGAAGEPDEPAGADPSLCPMADPHWKQAYSMEAFLGWRNPIVSAAFAIGGATKVPWVWQSAPRFGSRPLLLQPFPIPPLRSGPRFLYYEPFGGLGNQLFYLASALDLATQLNRILILPPVAPHGVDRDEAADTLRLVPWSRLLDMRMLNAFTPVVSWHGSKAMLQDYLGPGVQWSSVTPPRGARMSFNRHKGTCNFNETRWSTDHPQLRSLKCEPAQVLVVRCCLMWGWRMSAAAESVVWPHLRFRRQLVAATTALATQTLGDTWNAVHIRRGDKVEHSWYSKWAGMPAEEVLARMLARGFDPALPVYVATDERNASWFQPLEAAGFRLQYADDLDPGLLADELETFPPALWQDVLGVVEMVIATRAERFLGSLPSTFSGVIHNYRQGSELGAALGVSPIARPYFRKLKPSCCDEATLDMMPTNTTEQACSLFDFPKPHPLC